MQPCLAQAAGQSKAADVRLPSFADFPQSQASSPLPSIHLVTLPLFYVLVNSLSRFPAALSIAVVVAAFSMIVKWGRLFFLFLG